MAAPRSMTRLLEGFRKIERDLLHWIGVYPSIGFQGALVTDVNHHVNKPSSSVTSILDNIFSNTLLAVQRNRRSKERRLTRKMKITGHYEHALPRTDIVSCLNCGNWHEKRTICGHCYETVKAETKVMQESMGVDSLKYSAPRSEVVFLYNGEGESLQETETSKQYGKYVVKVEKERPSWFSQNLLKKGQTKKDPGS